MSVEFQEIGKKIMDKKMLPFIIVGAGLGILVHLNQKKNSTPTTTIGKDSSGVDGNMNGIIADNKASTEQKINETKQDYQYGFNILNQKLTEAISENENKNVELSNSVLEVKNSLTANIKDSSLELFDLIAGNNQEINSMQNQFDFFGTEVERRFNESENIFEQSLNGLGSALGKRITNSEESILKVSKSAEESNKLFNKQISDLLDLSTKSAVGLKSDIQNVGDKNISNEQKINAALSIAEANQKKLNDAYSLISSLSTNQNDSVYTSTPTVAPTPTPTKTSSSSSTKTSTTKKKISNAPKVEIVQAALKDGTTVTYDKNSSGSATSNKNIVKPEYWDETVMGAYPYK